MTGMNTVTGADAYAVQNGYGKDENKKQKGVDGAKDKAGIDKTDRAKGKNYGRTIGEPELSEKAQKYYEQLKKKYGNYDFILVSSEEKENAKANAAKYANGFKTVVLIDEEKIEKMATDEKFRKQYEGILSGASSQLDQLKNKTMMSGANVKGFGMQVNDNGTTSFFAVLKKSSDAQKARIEKKAEQKKADRKAADKRAEKKQKQERLKETNDGEKRIGRDDEETVTIQAHSIEELMAKIEDYAFAEKSNNVQTESEKQLGQNFDFRG